MATPFRVYRILCSTPPDLEPERELFESTLASFGETVTFPQQVLFAGASFPPTFHPLRHRAAAEANVGMCDFFLHIFSETWPGAPYQGFVDLARACLADPSQPMRRIAVLFRNFTRADETVRAFRATLAPPGACDVRDFASPAELDPLLRELFASWWQSVQTEA